MGWRKRTATKAFLILSVLVLIQLTNAEYSCGSIVDNTLTSPGYPNSYPDDLDCVYHVSITNGMALSIYFNDFDVEDESSCSYDYLKIADENNQIIGVYCGQRSGQTVYVTGQYAVISFHTDGSVQERGYQLFFSHVPIGEVTTPRSATTQVPYTTPQSYSCGSVANNILKSPGYPSDYPNNMDCVYRVPTSQDMALRIYFNDFDLEYESSCGYDYLKISSENRTIGTYCGQQSGQSILVVGNYAVLAFHSDGIIRHRGYELFFSQVHSGCLVTLNETFGEVEFNFSSYYFAHARCNWNIQSAGVSDAVALLSVRELNLDYCSEYAKITDGNGSSVFYHQGCVPFAPENLLDVQFGLSGNITVQVYLQSTNSNIKVNYAILKRGLTSAILVSGWNVTVSNPSSTSFTIQWSKLRNNIYRVAKSYVIIVKSTEGTLLGVEIVPGNSTSLTVKGLKPSTQYRVSVYGVDDIGQPYKSTESFTATTKVFCGSRPSGSRIVGGSVAIVNSWPWQVMLMRTDGRQFCGGSLVHPYWVVTAAHCVPGKTPSDVKIKLGAHYRTSGSVGTEQEIGVARIIIHENYDNPLSSSNDIALIKLVEPAVLGVGVGLVCLPDTSYPLPFDNIQKKCWITGWGTLSSGGSAPNTLMEAQVPLVSKQRCQSVYPGQIDDTMLCAGLDAGGVDTCQGDSGGPLVCEFNGTWHLEGITSWGYGCAYARKYGVYSYVRNLNSWVSLKIYQFSPATPLPQKPSVTSLVWCNFDEGLCSGWNQSSLDDFDWTLVTGSTPSSSTGPNTGQGGSGKYMYIETSSPRKPGEKAKLIVAVPNIRQKSCLSFYYHMHGASVGTLIVYSGNNKVFNVSGNQGNDWIMVERNLYFDGSVTFEGVAGNSYTGDIAIDSVEITEGDCPVSCNFDSGLCLGWSQSESDVFDWTLHSGPTPSSYTGPSSDHSGSGKYLYVEASYESAGDNAKLQFTVPRNKSACCLVFYYHMYGSDMGTLNVFSGNNKIFTKSGNQGNYWKKVTRTLYSSDMVTFEGIIGTSYRGDIAIDDVSVISGGCPGCGGALNQSSGELTKGNDGEEEELRCNWTIGNAGIREAVGVITLQRIYLSYCSEYFQILKADGTEVFSQQGCNSSLPNGTTLEVSFGATNHLIIGLSLEYRWSAVNIKFNIFNQGLNSAESVSSWNITVGDITSSSAKVSWTNFPLLLSVNYYLVRYKEVSNGVSRLYHVSRFSNTYYTNMLKAYQAYDFQVFAVAENDVIYASKAVSMQTEEGVPSRAPSNVRVENHGLNEFLVKWDPLPQQYVNGRLLGYNVYYKISSYYYYYLESIVNTSNPDISQVLLPNIQTGARYQISVAALTSKGHGPKSPYLYITKSCGGFVNQSFGWLNFTNTDYYVLNCSVSINNAGLSQGVALISFQHIYFLFCSEAVEIFDGDGDVVFSRGGCDSFPRGLAVEIPFAGNPSLTLEVILSYRYSYARIQYTVLDKPLSSAQVVPSWNVTITNITSSSLAVKWSNFPLSIPIQRFLVKYTELNSNFSLIFQFSTWYNTHHTGGVLKGYRLYEVTVIAVATGFGNDTYSSVVALTRTNEGVPSRAPSNVRVSNTHLGNLRVEWEPIPQQTANGRHLGYRVYFYEYYGYSPIQTVDTSSQDVHMMVLRGLKVAQMYVISVAAFTSKGAGPQSPSIYFTTGCGGHANQTFGQLHIGTDRVSSYLSCTFVIGSAGISQAVAIVWIEDMVLYYYGEYIKITDGNGSLALYQYAYSSSIWKSFLEVDFGQSDNITVEIYLRSSYSHFKLQYGIMKYGIQSALPMANWSSSIVNTTTRSITISWETLTPVLAQRTLYYVVVMKSANGSILNVNIVSGGTTSDVFNGLSPYTEYQVSVVGVDNEGNSFKISDVTVWTEEGVPSRAPSYISFTDVKATRITVNWTPLPQQYHNGRLLGYIVYFQMSAYYSYPVQRNGSSLIVSNPNTTLVTLTGLSPGQRYDISVSAFTSKGEGPRSNRYYVTTDCKMTVNQSFGLIDVTQTEYISLYCYWTIGNIGITRAVALFIIQKINLGYCSEYLKIFDGNGTLEYHQSGCSPSNHGSLVEVPFLTSNNITAIIYLIRLRSSAIVQYVVLGKSLKSAPLLPGWPVTVDNITSTSIYIHWTNLTSYLGRPVQEYIVLLNRKNDSALAHKVTHGNQLSTEITGLMHLTNYTVEVFGVDEQGQPYRTPAVNTRTKKVPCGSRPSITRIVGGTVAPVNSWPWQAMLRDSSGSQFCGGSLIHPQWVLTATHCICGKSTSSVKVRLGAHYRLSASVGTEQDFDVVKIIQHEMYNTPNRWSNDIALLKLSRPAKIGEGVGLVCLSDDNFQLPFEDANKTCWITGWGRLYYSYYYTGPQPNELMQVDVPLISNQRCNISYPGKVDDSMICVGRDQGGQGACKGDSGGPLVCEFNDKWYLEGLASWVGIPCADSLKPSVYVNVRKLKSWIVNKIASSASDTAQPPCNFDSGLCYGWQQSDSDDFDWTRYTGSTPSSNTGPSSDHTSGSGYYMYIEASSPRREGDNAKLELFVYGSGAAACLEFYYHMNGASMGSLTVFSGNVVVFSVSGNQGNSWKKVRRTVYLRDTVTFEGTVGSSYTGDIAIDDVSITKESCTGLLSPCNFDSELCDGWQQSDADVFDWTRNTGSTPSFDTGPSSDHTSGSGYYMYIEASSPRQRGDNAKLELTVPGSGAPACLEFYFHMYGATMGYLTVFSGNAVVFNVSGTQGFSWKKATRTIYLDNTVTFEGTVGSSFTGDIAIDDVLIINGRCTDPSGVPSSCNFDSGLCYVWQQSDADVFDWIRHTGSTSSSNTGPSADHTSGSGYYMYIEASSPRQRGDNAKLELSVPESGAPACLEFYFHMYGATMGYLTVFSGNAVVFNVSGTQGFSWRKATRTIYLHNTVTFEGTVGSSYTGDIAIDDVSIISGSCAAPTLPTCNFDSGLCSEWRQSYSDVFDWTRNSGSTPSFGTGPSWDHTCGSGYYMYIEASSPRRAGDYADLELSSFVSPGEVACLKFFYHMNGGSMGTLSVFSGNEVVFNATGNHGDYWRRALKTIYLQNTVTFRGIVGPSFTGDLAIDDVTITSGSCLGSSSFPTSETSSTVVPSWSPVPSSHSATSETSSTVVSSWSSVSSSDSVTFETSSAVVSFWSSVPSFSSTTSEMSSTVVSPWYSPQSSELVRSETPSTVVSYRSSAPSSNPATSDTSSTVVSYWSSASSYSPATSDTSTTVVSYWSSIPSSSPATSQMPSIFVPAPSSSPSSVPATSPSPSTVIVPFSSPSSGPNATFGGRNGGNNDGLNSHFVVIAALMLYFC